MKILPRCKTPFQALLLALIAGCICGSSTQAQDRDSLRSEPVPSERIVNGLYQSRQMKFSASATSQLSGEDVQNMPTVNRLNTLSGRVTGYLSTNLDGLPGSESASYYVRGVHTFNGSRHPVVLIDGRFDDVRMLDPYDIESISVLKDAAAASLYGLLSTNGVILITTKKANEGKISVRFNHQTSFSRPTRLPKFLDAYNYAQLYNEAMLNDSPGIAPRYGDEALTAFRDDTDPVMWPNTNWLDTFLEKNSLQVRNNLSVTGGNRNSRFYVSAGHYYSDGLFKTDPSVNTYNTNTNVNSYTIHGNIVVRVGQNLLVNADIRAKKDKRNAPGAYSSNYDEGLFSALYATPFNAYPVKNPNGSLGGTHDYQNNIYGMLNNSGYSIWESTSLSSFVDLTYDFHALLEGLKIKTQVGFNNYTDYAVNRTKRFAVYQFDGKENYAKIGQDTQIGSSGRYRSDYRNYQHSISLLYERDFGRHHVDGFLIYERIQRDNKLDTDLFNNYQGPKLKLSYRFRDTYLLDFSAALQGSEQFDKKNRYGFFPAVSAGWILTNEGFLKDNAFLSFLKFRGSYGLTGGMPDTYFGYLGAYSASSGASFGTNPSDQPGYAEAKVANPALTWSKTRKVNVGMDMTLFNHRFSAVLDFFSEHTHDILIENAITSMYGATVFTPEGKMKSRGYELSIGWKESMRKFQYFANVQFSHVQNEILFRNEPFLEYAWMYRTLKPSGTRFGYQFERYFTEGDDISELPDQSLLGTQQPGDLKYKDLNRDGVIDQYDIGPIGKSKIPEIYYGINAGFKCCNLDLNILFQGAANSTTYNSGYTYWDFNNKIGNVLEHHLQRWTPGSGQNAAYPRLSISNTNNYVASSYWVQDNSFIRLKYVELGYTLPKSISKAVHINSLRFFVNGSNLFCWDKVKLKDPEIQDNNINYPIQKTVSAGVNVRF